MHWDDEDSALEGVGPITPEKEDRWDASFKENRRRQERVGRAIENHLADGKRVEEAFDASMHEETALGLPLDESDEIESDEDDEDGEDWRDSLPEEVEYDDEDWSSEEGDSNEPFGFDRRERHPLLERSTELLLRLHELFKDEGDSHNSIGTLMQGTMEISGGLAQRFHAKTTTRSPAGLPWCNSSARSAGPRLRSARCFRSAPLAGSTRLFSKSFAGRSTDCGTMFTMNCGGDGKDNAVFCAG